MENEQDIQRKGFDGRDTSVLRRATPEGGLTEKSAEPTRFWEQPQDLHRNIGGVVLSDL